MNNKKTIIKIGRTVSSNFSEEEIKRIIKGYFSEQFDLENSGDSGLFIQLPNKNIVLHAGEVQSRNAFIAQYWPPIMKFLDESEIIQHVDQKIDQNKISSSYHKFIFRCLRTLGVEISGLSYEVTPWNSLNEFISAREASEKEGNKSSYVTVNDDTIVLVGKTYGAQTGESLIILGTLNKLKGEKELFFTPMPETKPQQSEGISKNLLDYVEKIGAKFIDADLGRRNAEKDEVSQEEIEIRDQTLFKMNLDKKFEHECYVCGASGLGVLVASHIHRVTDIKKHDQLSTPEKVILATTNENGIWLCRNHDVLFEYGNMWFDDLGELKFSDEIRSEENKSLFSNLKREKIEDKHFTEEMQRNLDFHRKRTNR